MSTLPQFRPSSVDIEDDGRWDDAMEEPLLPDAWHGKLREGDTPSLSEAFRKMPVVIDRG